MLIVRNAITYLMFVLYVKTVLNLIKPRNVFPQVQTVLTVSNIQDPVNVSIALLTIYSKLQIKNVYPVVTQYHFVNHA